MHFKILQFIGYDTAKHRTQHTGSARATPRQGPAGRRLLKRRLLINFPKRNKQTTVQPLNARLSETLIRAPLHIVRDPLPNPGWKPLLLSMYQVSSYKGLVEVLAYIASLSNHTQPIVPILVDENIHKRCLKFLYSDRMQQWNWHEKLKGTPVLYGCWHPYKFPVTNVWRRFHSRFV